MRISPARSACGPARWAVLGITALSAVLAGCGGGDAGSGQPAAPAPVITGPAWSGFARDAQHSALGATGPQGGVAAQPLARIAWTTPVDLAMTPTPIHYGAPLISRNNTVIIPVKTKTTGVFVIEARSGYDGRLIWRAADDYILPQANPGANAWISPLGATLTPAGRLYLPGSGGKLWIRDQPDSASGTLQPLVFYGAATYAAAAAAFDASVFINSPITADAGGNVYFSILVNGANPANLASGYVRVGADGTSTWVAANAALGVPALVPYDSATNAAPALSPDGATLYVAAVATLRTSPYGGMGYLLALDSATLATRATALLVDPATQAAAGISDFTTSSPLIGPDGDVYYGVLESNVPAHNERGWLLHFDATLATRKTPGSFGWDNTPSIIPAGEVAAYAGGSRYLLLSKYNNYADVAGGDGLNRMAILDPNASEVDPIAGVPVMGEVITLLGQTSDAANFPNKPGAVKEWCVNTAAVDPIGHAALMNSEDGYLYRWNLVSGQVDQRIQLDGGLGQAYTPTALGPDGTIYAINNGVLHAVGR